MTAAGIVATAQSTFRTHRSDANYAEMVQEVAIDALAAAAMDPDEIDAVVFSMGPTDFVGITDVERWAVGSIGMAGKPLMRVQLGGTTGLAAAQAGYYHVASGSYDNVLVIGGDRIAETPDGQRVLTLMWDPFFERGMGLNTIAMTAMHAQLHMHRYGTTTDHLDQVAIRAWRAAARNPRAHLKGELDPTVVAAAPAVCLPLRRYDICPRSSGAAAVVVSSEKAIARSGRDAAWITGVGSCATSVFIGDRLDPRAPFHYADWDELGVAAATAYGQADITDPLRQLDVAEIYAPFTISLLSAVEALGLCEKGASGPALAEGRFDDGGEVVVNPSGGALCSNPIAATGLVRVCEAADQVLGRAGDHQVPGARRALASAPGGTYQFQSVLLLDREAQR